MFIGKSEVPHPACSRAALGIVIDKRQRDLCHTPSAEPLLQGPLVDQGAQPPAALEVVVQHQFVFGKCLTGEQRTAEIEVCRRPRGVRAEPSQVGSARTDLRLRKDIAEAGHLGREGQLLSAVGSQSYPVASSLTSDEGAIGKVRQWHINRRALRRTPAIKPVTGGAGRL